MSLLSSLGAIFTRGGRDEALLNQAMDHAKCKRPEKALEIYDSLLKSPALSGSLRARVLYNRGLTHSALRNEEQALTDIQEVLKLPDVPDNVQAAAKERLVRLRKRAGN
ncbi:MAG TPA: tetratricopeptide repeat protein [Pirellulaceae bacterium]|nr:tetratricopeptide repeat protein [Pirellulaceae bacterium]